jgi:transposase
MREGVLVMKAEDQLKLEVVVKVEAKRLSRPEAMTILQVSLSTLKRFLKSYREKGIGFLRHGNATRKPANRTPDAIKDEVQRLMKDKYFDFNMTHALEKIHEDLGVNLRRETFRKWCHEFRLVKREKRRRSRPRVYRDRMSQPGLLIQMDGSHHRWFGERQTCLIAAIDDATSEVIHAEFYEGETTLACLDLLKKAIRKKGAFQLLYTDKAGVFGGIKRNHFSQVERALSEVGTQVIYAHSPEAKGRVERLFNTLQDRLIPEMRLSKVRTLAQANEYLVQYLAQTHTPRFTVLAHNPVSAYRALAPNADLESIFCMKEYRIIGRDHTVNIGGEKYVIADQLRFSIHKQRLELRMDKSGSWQAFFAGRPIKLVKVQKMPTAGARAA